jgi:prepilin-type N-terminal cleavage/methylation domain-containing protein
MKFAIYKTSGQAFKKAGAAVSKNGGVCGGFSLLELMVVVVIIGILATLAYSSLMDIIFTSRAKETAQTMRTFAERALSESKRMNTVVTIKISGGNIQYAPKGNSGATPVMQPLGSGYSKKPSSAPTQTCEPFSGDYVSFNDSAYSQLKIGISGIALALDTTKTQGYFAVCDAKDYCGAAVKVKTKNSFVACIKKPNAANWEAL